jgi:hypothetical protein
MLKQTQQNNGSPLSRSSTPRKDNEPISDLEVNSISKTNYIKLTQFKTRRDCYCPACIDSDFVYTNDFLLRDDDPAIFQLFGKELVK